MAKLSELIADRKNFSADAQSFKVVNSSWDEGDYFLVEAWNDSGVYGRFNGTNLQRYFIDSDGWELWGKKKDVEPVKRWQWIVEHRHDGDPGYVSYMLSSTLLTEDEAKNRFDYRGEDKIRVFKKALWTETEFPQ